MYRLHSCLKNAIMHFRLAEEILKLSDSKSWDFAKLEWNFEMAYESEEEQTCLCGHYPIRNICVIKNKKTNNVTEVGNCCINKFLGIEDGNKVFTSIKRLKDDLTKSISVDVIKYMKNSTVLSEFEYHFYMDIHKKRNLSEKQLDLKKRINRKLIDFTSYEANSQFKRINYVLKWAQNKPDFDISFILSIKSSVERTGKLTDNQKKALDNIFKKWKIE